MPEQVSIGAVILGGTNLLTDVGFKRHAVGKMTVKRLQKRSKVGCDTGVARNQSVFDGSIGIVAIDLFEVMRRVNHRRDELKVRRHVFERLPDGIDLAAVPRPHHASE